MFQISIPAFGLIMQSIVLKVDFPESWKITDAQNNAMFVWLNSEFYGHTKNMTYFSMISDEEFICHNRVSKTGLISMELRHKSKLTRLLKQLFTTLKLHRKYNDSRK